MTNHTPRSGEPVVVDLRDDDEPPRPLDASELQLVLDDIVQPVMVIDEDGRVLTANPSARAQFGHAPEGNRIELPDRPEHQAGTWTRMGGRDVWVSPVGPAEPSNRRLLVVSPATAATTPTTDSITGLPDRRAFLARADEVLTDLADQGRTGLLLVIDIDDFRMVSASIGPAAGDQLLAAFARRLRSAFPTTAVVGRLGGDEFGVLWPGADDPEEATARVFAACQAPVFIDGKETHLSTSTGVVVSAPGTDAPALLRQADTATSRAKHRGRGRTEVFDRQIELEGRRRVDGERALRQALRNRELVLHYQPLVSLASDRIVGVEALVRWQPAGKPVRAPAAFLPIAEATGLIVEIGRWVVDAACAELAGWRRQALADDLSVSINLSVRQLADPGLIDDLAAAIAAHEVPPHQLELEVTESVLMEDVQATSTLLARCRDLGISVAIDDFGTGYCSLQYLRALPVDVLKIDRVFVHDLADDPGDRAIVGAIIEMASALGLTTVGEGVEHEQQLARLRELGCNAAQGFHLARPMPATEMARLLRERSER